MAFQKGHPKYPGSGRKQGCGSKRYRTFYKLLDGDGFSLKEQVRAAVLNRDAEWTRALAALLKALDAGTIPADAESQSDDTVKHLYTDAAPLLKPVNG